MAQADHTHLLEDVPLKVLLYILPLKLAHHRKTTARSMVVVEYTHVGQLLLQPSDKRPEHDRGAHRLCSLVCVFVLGLSIVVVGGRVTMRLEEWFRRVRHVGFSPPYVYDKIEPLTPFTRFLVLMPLPKLTTKNHTSNLSIIQNMLLLQEPTHLIIPQTTKLPCKSVAIFCACQG